MKRPTRAMWWMVRMFRDIFEGFKNAPGIAHLDRWQRRRSAVANLQLAWELQKFPELADAGRKLEESARQALR